MESYSNSYTDSYTAVSTFVMTCVMISESQVELQVKSQVMTQKKGPFNWKSKRITHSRSMILYLLYVHYVSVARFSAVLPG
jgi:hypothetical protein